MVGSPPQFDDDRLPSAKRFQQDLLKAHTQGGIDAAIDFLRNQGNYDDIDLNIAVLGEMKAGKSSLINSILGKCADDDDAAAVGVTQTTMEPAPYKHPRNDKLILWDLPGAGSSEFPAAQYLTQMKAERYDFFILVTDTAFKEIYHEIAKAIHGMDKRMIFVRTKVDDAVRNNERSRPRSHKEEQVLSDIRKEIADKLARLELSPKVFLVDSYDPLKYDYPSFTKTLIDDFPREKRNALILSLNALTDDMVDRKVAALGETITKVTVWSGLVGAVPVPFLSTAIDATLILTTVLKFRVTLGLDDQRLDALYKEYPQHKEKMREIVDGSGILKLVSTKGLLDFIGALSKTALMLSAEEMVRFVPLLGSIVAAGLSAATTRQILCSVLAQMQITSKQILRVIAGEHVPITEISSGPLNDPDYEFHNFMSLSVLDIDDAF